MDLGLENKVAVITGGSRGIGKGIALGLAREKCHLVICARGEDILNETADEIREAGAEVLTLALDVTKTEDLNKLKDSTLQKFGTIDILVNNVGGNKRNEFDQTTEQDWQDIIDLNLLSHANATRIFLPHLKQQGSGSVIFISSIFGRESGGPTLSIYNSTKSALISMAKVIAAEVAPYGVRVNTVAPGSIRFPGGSWDRRCIEDPDGMAEFVKRELPIGRFGSAEEVANVVCFLASESASLVTGACINVDGGQSRSLI